MSWDFSRLNAVLPPICIRGGVAPPRAIKPPFEPPFARFRFQLTRLNQQTSNCADKEKKEKKKQGLRERCQAAHAGGLTSDFSRVGAGLHLEKKKGPHEPVGQRLKISSRSKKLSLRAAASCGVLRLLFYICGGLLTLIPHAFLRADVQSVFAFWQAGAITRTPPARFWRLWCCCWLHRGTRSNWTAQCLSPVFAKLHRNCETLPAVH